MPQYHEMRVDQYYDLDLHFLLYTAITIALYTVYYTLKLLIFLSKYIARRTCFKPKVVEAEKSAENAKGVGVKKPVKNKTK